MQSLELVLIIHCVINGRVLGLRKEFLTEENRCGKGLFFFLFCLSVELQVICNPYSFTIPPLINMFYLSMSVCRMCLEACFNRHKVTRIWIGILFVFEVERIQISFGQSQRACSCFVMKEGVFLPALIIFCPFLHFFPELFCVPPLLLAIYFIVSSLISFILAFSLFKVILTYMSKLDQNRW